MCGFCAASSRLVLAFSLQDEAKHKTEVLKQSLAVARMICEKWHRLCMYESQLWLPRLRSVNVQQACASSCRLFEYFYTYILYIYRYTCIQTLMYICIYMHMYIYIHTYDYALRLPIFLASSKMLGKTRVLFASYTLQKASDRSSPRLPDQDTATETQCYCWRVAQEAVSRQLLQTWQKTSSERIPGNRASFMFKLSVKMSKHLVWLSSGLAV